MEAYSVIEVEPISVFIGEGVDNSGDGYYYANITYKITNPSKLDININWAESLISFVYGDYESGESLDQYSYKPYMPGDLVIEAGGEAEIVLRWFQMKDEVYENSIFESRDPTNAIWYSFCRINYRPVDFDFSKYTQSGSGIIKEAV